MFPVYDVYAVLQVIIITIVRQLAIYYFTLVNWQIYVGLIEIAQYLIYYFKLVQ